MHRRHSLSPCCTRALQGVWASKYNERALLSMRKVGLDFRDLRMAVLVQRVVPAAYAFVIHTHNPSTGAALLPWPNHHSTVPAHMSPHCWRFYWRLPCIPLLRSARGHRACLAVCYAYLQTTLTSSTFQTGTSVLRAGMVAGCCAGRLRESPAKWSALYR